MRIWSDAPQPSRWGMVVMPDRPKIRRVIIVDDEPLIASTLGVILRRNRFDAESFTKPREALMASKIKAPDLLISDFMMPLLSGIELANQVKETCPKCKVLLISGRIFDEEFLDALLKNGRRFEVLSKPVHPSDLLQKVQTMMQADSPRAVARETPHMDIPNRSA